MKIKANNNCEAPDIAISVITYNHEKYIVDTIEGIIMQESKYSFKVFITDDNSTDNTAKICEEYVKKYPLLIDFEVNQTNLGSLDNWFYNLTKCYNSGAPLIAICEGDDYWIDKSKLHHQITHLNKNPSTSLTFHRSELMLDGIPLETSGLLCINANQYFSGKDIIEKWTIPTASVVFRRKVLETYLPRKNNNKYIYGDIILFLSATEHGKLFYMNRTMSVYRRHGTGITQVQSSPEFYERVYQHRDAISRDFGGKFSFLRKTELADCYFSISLLFIKQLKFKGIKYLFKAILYKPSVLITYISNKIMLL
ncbi:glycosyltransferase [Robiginitalea sp. IMCC43444]|uniref:glycosyltransferase n=1 Tax=Robiginitalea sp. IMCC43444 TaxID=3459121 RepID=UPI00404207E3